MKIVIVFWGSLMILFSSCSSTHQLLYCTAIKEKAEGEKAKIKLKNGEEIEAMIIEIGIDSTINNKYLSYDERIIPSSQITEIQLKDSWTGALEFAGAGLLLGLGITAIVASTENDSRAAGLTLIIIGPLITVGASILSMLPGAIIGHRDEYVFSESFPYEFIKIKFLSEKKRKINVKR